MLSSPGPSAAEPGRPHAGSHDVRHMSLKPKVTEEGKPPLDAEQEEKVVEEKHFDAPTTYEIIRRAGEHELERKPAALFWSGLAAGLAMGFSMVAQGVLHAHLPDTEWRPLITKLGYPVGFLIVILGSQQLFTENTLTPIVPLFARRGWSLLRRVAMLWSVVFVANILGAAIFAWVAGRTGIFELDTRTAFAELGRKAMEGDALLKFGRAIIAGWLIALMVWMIPAASAGKITVIVIVTYLVGVTHMSHIIAGSIDVLQLSVIGEQSWMTYVTDFMLPVLLGNIVGGVTLVAALNHAQVVTGKR